ncbi:hypothetical protein [Bordetella sp. BOR01]|uniref:hypothetical protein n=1 Tax=Bordetella sp. BOR01 TaxID=2854779 RepID=UPI001C46ACC5|nr:hypothetical protein [Bordetella sp. BOR01]MBV7481976.1 hypothetical protein [Bordetella sp. BOR01]
MPHYSDPGIPTLTQRAEPTLSPVPDTPAAGGAHNADLPVLTQVADHPVPNTRADAAGGAGSPQAAWSTAAGAGAGDAVLRAALQAELEQALQRALDDATAGMRTRLEAELPALIDRAVRAVRPG